MLKEHNLSRRFTLLGELRDRKAEDSYIQSEHLALLKQMKLSLLLGGCFFALLFVLDYVSFRSDPWFWFCLFSRLSVLIATIAFVCTAGRIRSPRTLGLAASLLEIFAFIMYLAALCIFFQKDNTLQNISLYIFFIFIFGTPNFLLYNILVSLLFCLAYFFVLPQLLPHYISHYPLYQILGAVGIIAFSSFSARQISIIKRQQFIHALQLHEALCTDQLTGVYSRSYFDRALEQACATQDKESPSFSLIMYDLDDFKRVNDSCGHHTGDLILVQAARLPCPHIGTAGQVARWGGEEFMIMLPGQTAEEAVAVAEAVRAAFTRECFGIPFPLTASFGVTSYAVGDTPDAMMIRADNAMYAAKRAGKNTVRCLPVCAERTGN